MAWRAHRASTQRPHDTFGDRCQAQVSEDRFVEKGATKGSGMRNYPRRGGRLSLECSCAGRVVDWALTPWGDRLYGVQLLKKGEHCRIARHASGGGGLGSRPRGHAAAEILRHANADDARVTAAARRLRPAP